VLRATLLLKESDGIRQQASAHKAQLVWQLRALGAGATNPLGGAVRTFLYCTCNVMYRSHHLAWRGGATRSAFHERAESRFHDGDIFMLYDVVCRAVVSHRD